MDFLELKDWQVIVSKITTMEKETWWTIKVKVPYKETTLDMEELKLSELKQKLDDSQGNYDNQLEFVNNIKAL